MVEVAGAGIYSGSFIWQHFILEYNIDKGGKRSAKDIYHSDAVFKTFYAKQSNGIFIPRNIMADAESDAIDNIKSQIPKNSNTASVTFANGYYGVGKEMIDEIRDELQRLSDSCDNLDGFIVNHSVGGGTGSGLTALILDHLVVDYMKKCKFYFGIWTNYNSQKVIQTYNKLLSMRSTLDHIEISMLFDNGRLQNICRDGLLIEASNYENINILIARSVSLMTHPLRF